MTDINQNQIKTHQKSKTLLILFVVALLILIVAGGYLVYANSLDKTAEDHVARVNKTNNAVANTTANTVDDQSTSADKSIRDPNRYYYDLDGYSFIVPEGMEAKPAEDVYPPDNIAESHNIVID